MRRYAGDIDRGSGDGRYAAAGCTSSVKLAWVSIPPSLRTVFLAMAALILMLGSMLIYERTACMSVVGPRIEYADSPANSRAYSNNKLSSIYTAAAAATGANLSPRTHDATSAPPTLVAPTPVTVKAGEPAVVPPAPHMPLAPMAAVEHPFPSRPMSSEGVATGPAKTPLVARESEHAAECRARYPFLDHMKLPVPAWRENVFIALNLHNSGHLTSALHAELLRLAHTLAATPRAPDAPPLPADANGLDPSCVYVSIYESGSGDGTAAALQKLAAALSDANVPHTIITGGSIGKDDSNRIKGFARIRNAAMAPLYDAIRAHRRSDGKEGWTADRVIFINDVFWCAEDALRLLAVGDGGADTDALDDTHSYSADELSRQAASLRVPASARPAIGLLGSVSPPAPLRAPGARPHMVCGVDYERSNGPGGFMFYDHWAMRERDGDKNAARQYPFYKDEFDRAAYDEARRMDVFTCWGGIVCIDGSVFTQHGLALRARTEHCAQSECAHIGTDIIAAIGADAWIQQDNMVATTYNDGVRDGLPSSPWFSVAARLSTRRERAQLRRTGDLGGCKQLREAQGLAWETGKLCPAMPYPLAVFQGGAAAYPPQHYCCGEYLQGPVYWMNCHATVTQVFSPQQRAKYIAADFDPFVDLHTHASVPHEWA